MSNAFDMPRLLLQQVCHEGNPERLARIIADLRHHRAVLKGECRRLKTIVRSFGNNAPENLRAELSQVYELDDQYGKALRIAKINLQSQRRVGR